MKFTLTLLAAVTKGAPGERKRQKSPSKIRTGVPSFPCTNQQATITNSDVGQSGRLIVKNYQSDAHCYIDFASQCGDDGVHVEIVKMTVENDYDYEWNDQTQKYDYFYGNACFDGIFFAWQSEDGLEQTEAQCGCLDSTSHPTCSHSDIDFLYPTEKPTKYNLIGTDAKFVLFSDETNEGGKITVDWKCRTSTTFIVATNTLEMAQAVLTGDFTPSMAQDYGCSSRGLFEAFSPTLGHHIDDTDAAFQVWKTCVQCATRDGTASDILPYAYNVAEDTCGKFNSLPTVFIIKFR